MSAYDVGVVAAHLDTVLHEALKDVLARLILLGVPGVSAPVMLETEARSGFYIP